MKIPVDKILPNPQQPRTKFNQAALEDLAFSIRDHGLINPIAVEEAGENYILIDGERRLRAHKLIGLTEIEASIRPSMDGNGSQERLVLALIANIQRENNNPVEEAKAFKKLRGMGYSAEEIAQYVGMSPGLVYSRLNLLQLDEPIQALIAAGKIGCDARVQKALLSLEDPKIRIKIATRCAQRKTSARDLVAVCTRMANAKSTSRKFTRNQVAAIEIVNKNKAVMAMINSSVRISGQQLEKAIEQTCKECVLSDEASEITCKDCPLVVLLKQLSPNTERD
jgi:ParB family transcriptional regulator, chromosome partitioning protein